VSEESREFRSVGVERALEVLEARALDSRPALLSPFPSLNDLLHRGGFHPGELVVLGGRMHTRKTAVALNMVVQLLKDGVPVGFLTLDESLAMYSSKFLSAYTGTGSELLERQWKSPQVKKWRKAWAAAAQRLTLSEGVRPNFNQLQQWLLDAEFDRKGRERPRVVFVDYTSLLVHYRTDEVQRVPRLMEELQVFTHENELVTVALHQAGRMDEGVSKRNHGDTPGTAEALLYGGEQQADIILNTYRPALNQLGNMSLAQAKMILRDKFDEDEWQDAVGLVRRYQDSTFVQLLKNRPGTKLCFEGIEVTSRGDSQQMAQVGFDFAGDIEGKGAAR